MNAAPAQVRDATIEGLYAASYARLVGLLTVVCGNAADAEEVVQEAFARLIPAWDKVRGYDDPEAWLRAVAFRLSTSRWRRARVAARGLVRLGPPPDVPPPDGDRLDAERLLAALPRGYREVLVLYHGLGLPVGEIATELGIAPGTVKSRLSRARAAAAAQGGDA
jgi:RNA polymerase sigma-70 factor (ECF subfamily)